jgi:hypothetical protein
MAGARAHTWQPRRRFGGVLLGPARFTHINNAARRLLEAEGFIQAGGARGKAASGRRKAARPA